MIPEKNYRQSLFCRPANEFGSSSIANALDELFQSEGCAQTTPNLADSNRRGTQNAPDRAKRGQDRTTLTGLGFQSLQIVPKEDKTGHHSSDRDSNRSRSCQKRTKPDNTYREQFSSARDRAKRGQNRTTLIGPGSELRQVVPNADKTGQHSSDRDPESRQIVPNADKTGQRSSDRDPTRAKSCQMRTGQHRYLHKSSRCSRGAATECSLG